jgi:glycerophosphoryl diester phosphodiesterase
MIPTTITRNGRSVGLTCHMAVLSGRFRRNGRDAIAECFEANAGRLEVDIHSLDGPDYIVSHERRLERETTGSGSIGDTTPDDVRALHYLDDAGDRPPLLSELIAMAAGSVTQIQLDLKDWRAMPADRIATLLEVIAPVHDRIMITTGQDWNINRLHAADPALALGFDPGRYIDHGGETGAAFLPRNLGAYGYRDDHPLAVGRTETAPVYLYERMTALVAQAPSAREHFLDYHLILQMLDDGFNVASWLHERGLELTAWTVDYGGDDSVGVVERLIDAGVDRITTNTIPAWVEAFGTQRTL